MQTAKTANDEKSNHERNPPATDPIAKIQRLPPLAR
jgi:hypothetical protein